MSLKGPVSSAGPALCALLCACAPSPQAARAPQDDSSPPAGEMPPAAAGTVGSQDAEGPHPLSDSREADPERALPELTYQHLGMHIGGESNSPESKRPWLDDIEAGEEKLLYCFRLVDAPEKGGSYGVDLYVGTDGGAPEIRATRQKIGGKPFDECMREAFSALDFHKPERPTMLSYSLLFELGE